MVKLICDKCGSDCDRIGYDVSVRALHNFIPYTKNDIGEPQITCDNSHVRFVLCQECYIKMGLPYLCVQEGAKEVVWKETPEEE